MDAGATKEGRVSLRSALAVCCGAGVRPLVWMGVGALLQAGLPVLGLFAMQALVDAVALGVAGDLAADAAWTAALQATGLAAAVAFGGAALRSVTSVLAENHGRKLADGAVHALQLHAAAVSLDQFERPAFHDALQRAGAEGSQRPVRLTQDLLATLVAALSLVAMSALLLRVEPWLPLLVGVAALPVAWSRRRHARLRFAWQRDHVVEQRAVGYLGGVLTGRATAKDVRAIGLRAVFGARLADLRAGLRASLARLAKLRARDELLVHTLASAALFGAYVYLADAALGGLMTLGGLVLHAQAAQRTQNAVRDLLASTAGIHEHRLFLRPYVDFLATPTSAPPRAPTTTQDLVRLEGVSYTYPSASRPALHGIQFSVAAGERVAVIGANGSGKSTLIKVLAGLHHPSAGAIRHRAAAKTAVLWQDAAAFELTIRENLELGCDAPLTDATLLQALDDVGLRERVAQLPHGLDTPWSRRLRGGCDWSVGEARRIVLARELLRPCDLLLLDEPFASLDGKAARRVAAHLSDGTRERAVVLVDHRGPGMDCVDRVIWLDQGRVVMDGPPSAVRAHPGFCEQFPDWMQ